MDIKKIKSDALEQLREYLVINDIEIDSKEDFIVVYLKMRNEGYFYQAERNDALEEVKETITELAKAFEKDKDILEKDLILFGPRRVIEKLEGNKTAKR